jgi:hypothetical protein
VQGPAKLIATTNVQRFVNGKPLFGAVTKEFEIKAEKKGKATVKITVKDVVDKKTATKENDCRDRLRRRIPDGAAPERAARCLAPDRAVGPVRGHAGRPVE